MTLISVLVFFIIVGGCTKTAKRELTHEVPQDTVYEGGVKDESQAPVIHLDNGSGSIPKFSAGDTSILRIRIGRFEEYEIQLREIVGAKVLRVDTASNIFHVIPNEDEFSFSVYQNYPEGKVIRYIRKWNEEKVAYDEEVVPLQGDVRIARFHLRTN